MTDELKMEIPTLSLGDEPKAEAVAEAPAPVREVNIEDKIELTEEEKRASTIGYYAEQANGWGLLDTGTGSMDKVHVKDGKLTTGGMGIMTAYVYICGRCYEVKDTTLVEV